MDTAFTIQEAGREDCRDWPLGKCTKGDECTRYHHPNLDPEQLGEGTYMVPDDTTKACDRCLSRIYPCDKPSRGPGADDPCSECRWFGGPTCRCVIPKSGGYNDKLWRLMMARGKSLNYTLPKYKHRDEATNNKDLPSEMPSANIIVGWVGESKEDLLKKGDMLPAGVRDSPVVTAANDYLKAMLTSKLQQRGYLVPPALSGVEQRAQDRKRKRNEAETTIPASPAPSAPPLPQKPSFALPLGSGRPSSQPAPAIPQMPPPPAIPQLDPNHGRVVNMSYSCLDSVWTVTYRSGITITGPAGPPPPESHGERASTLSRTSKPTDIDSAPATKKAKAPGIRGAKPRQSVPAQSETPAAPIEKMMIDEPELQVDAANSDEYVSDED